MRKITLFLLVILSPLANAQIIEIADSDFKNALVNTNCVDTDLDGTFDDDADTNNDGEIEVAEAEAVISLNVSNRNINYIGEIEYFINLEILDFSHNHVVLATTFFEQPNLRILDCSYNNLGSLSVVLNPDLTSLECQNNIINDLNIRNGNNTELQYFDARNNFTTLLFIYVDNEIYANNQPFWFKDGNVNYTEHCLDDPWFYSNFDDGSLQCWTNQDGGATMLTNEATDPPVIYQERMIQKICDGSNSAVGKMAIINQSVEPFYLFNSLIQYEFVAKNDNNFDLVLHVGFKDVNGNRMVFYNSDGENVVPALSEWDNYDIHRNEVFLDGSFDFEQVVEMKVYHNEDSSPTYDGQIVNGQLHLLEFGGVFLLNNDDHLRSNIQIIPNPSKGKVVISANTILIDYSLYDMTGKFIDKEAINNFQRQLDISHLSKGMYFVEITTEHGKEVHKLIKN